ncbi:MAG: hypothetical protein LBK83_14785 [Treponema sp.]|jgi:hypothetical protein|nr:hypothetical protein [Treponema sp.]
MKPRLISKAILGIAGFLFLGNLPCSFGQTRQGTDLILLLDVSSSMSAWHEEVSGYLSGPFLKENLKIGDTFHLISIAGKPRLEISRLVEGRGDLETIIGRMFLMYPLESSADLAGALSFADSYISSLPSPRSKKVVLVTDGGENEADRISDAGRRLETGGNSFVYVQVPQALAKYGPSLTAPPAAVASGSGVSQSGGDSAGTDASPRSQGSPASQGQSSPALQRQGSPASEGQGASVSQGQGSPTSGQDSPSLPGQGSSVLQGQSAASGQPAPAGEEQAPASPAAGTGFEEQFSDSGEADSGQGGTVFRESTEETSSSAPVTGGDTGSSEAQSPASPVSSAPSEGESRPSGAAEDSGRAAGSGLSLSMPVLAGLGIGALLVLGLIIFLVARRLQDSPKRVIAQAASPSPAPASPVSAAASRPSGSDTSVMENYAASRKPRSTPYQNTYKPPARTEGPLMISLFVEDQNTMIGKRNIHIAKPGYSFTVGGGKSDFLIFLVSVPPHIAEVRVDGERCAFIPRKPQFFPDTGSQQISDCIGKMIRIVSEKGYELHLRMERYEDPLLSLNRLLHSVDVPG